MSRDWVVSAGPPNRTYPFFRRALAEGFYQGTRVLGGCVLAGEP